MKDVRSFLRYILPGLVFSIWLLISLLISDTDKTICFLKEASDKAFIGVIATTFLASGALGYIFSVVYWALYWLPPLSICKIKIDDIAIDHRPLLKGLTEMEKICVVDIHGDAVDLDNISKMEAFVIFSQNWWTSRIKNEADRYKFIFIDRLADITHAIGTALISILFSLAAWAIIHLALKSEFSICTGKGLIFIILQIFLIWAFCKNYWDICKSIRSLLHSLFANMVEKQFTDKDTGGRITIYYEKIV